MWISGVGRGRVGTAATRVVTVSWQPICGCVAPGTRPDRLGMRQYLCERCEYRELLSRHTVQTGVEDRQGCMLEGNAERSVEATLGHLRVMDGPAAPAQAPTPLTLEDLNHQHHKQQDQQTILLVDEPATAEDVVQEAFTGLH